jgi:hypothetical protein
MPTNGQLATGTQSLILKNQKGENILTIDEFGNLTIPGVINSQSSATSTQPSAISLSIDWILEQFKNVVVTAKEFVAEKITGKQVCVEDVCVNRDQFKELLDKNGIGQSAPAPTPTVAVDVTPADTTATSTENSTTTPADTQAPASTTEPVASGPLPN